MEYREEIADEKLFGNESIDIIFDDNRLEKYGDNQMLFNDANSIVLYTMLNKDNTQLLIEDKYNEYIKAYEYYDIPNEYQGQCIVQIAYDTHGLFDTLHPSALKIMQETYNLLKKNKIKEIDDLKVLRYIFDNMGYTAIRFISREDNKLYPNSKMFKQQKIRYTIKPHQCKYITHKVIK